MIGWDVLFAFVIALFYSFLLLPALAAGPGRRAEFGFVLALEFLLLWLAAVWLRPVGPLLYNVPWLIMLGLGGVIALVFTVLMVPWPRRPHHAIHILRGRPYLRETVYDLPPGSTRLREDSPESAVADATTLIFGLFFWVLVILLLGAIFARYKLGP